jgi:hypothetical protein
MNVTNRARELVSATVFKSKSFLDVFPPSGGKYFDPDMTHDLNARAPEGYLYAHKRRLNMGTWTGGPFANTSRILIIKAGNELGFVNWSRTQADWQGLRQQFEARSQAIEPGIAIASALLGALVTGLAATGPKGALPSGMLLGVGSLILLAVGGANADLPPAPDLASIKKAVEDVVDEAIKANAAKEQAPSLLLAARWLSGAARTAHSDLLGRSDEPPTGELPDHDYLDFREDLEDHVRQQRPFQQNLGALQLNPDWGKFVLPALIAGVAANLQARRLHDCVRRLDRTRLTDEDLDAFQGDLRTGRAAIAAARDALRAFAQKEVAKCGLTGTPEGHEIAGFIYFKYTGSSDLTFVDGALQNLDNIEGMVGADIKRLQAGTAMQHYWHPTWDAAPRAPIRNMHA